jgi:hypothetical protein
VHTWGIRVNKAGVPADLRVDTDQRLIMRTHQALATGIALTASNDAGSGFIPLEIQGNPVFINNGPLTIAKLPVSLTAPGVNSGKFELVTGTTGTSCKLLFYAGTSGTPVTLADNIGSGC